MFEPVAISPSILSANFMNLERDIELIEQAGAEYVHVDVMDGHFVGNLTMGVPLVRQLARVSALPLDIHLMIANPLVQLPWYLDAGARLVTVHDETLYGEELMRAIEIIHAGGAKAGVAIKPHTPPEVLCEVLPLIDMVLVMSVEPGFSGQHYIEGSEEKVARVVKLARTAGVSPLIEVDGGVGFNTAARVVEAGADVLVCGNAIFGAQEPAHALTAIKEAAEAARMRALTGGQV